MDDVSFVLQTDYDSVNSAF